MAKKNNYPQFVEPQMSKARNTRTEWRVLSHDNVIHAIPVGCFQQWMRDMGMEPGLYISQAASIKPTCKIPLLLANGEPSGFTLLPKCFAMIANPAMAEIADSYTLSRVIRAKRLKSKVVKVVRRQTIRNRSGVIN